MLCLEIDYIHLMGFVHLDISASNILVTQNGNPRSVRISDLEFLRPTGSSVDNKLLGTPGQIAPEVLRNEFVSMETDNYSLGCVLTEMVRDYIGDHPSPGDNNSIDSVLSVCTKLTQEGRYVRPKFLLEELLASGYMNSEEYNYYSTRLLRLLMLSNIRATSPTGRFDCRAISRVFREKIGVLGLHGDMIELLVGAYETRHPLFCSALSDLLRSDHFFRSGSYWIARLTDARLNRVYCQLNSFIDVSTQSQIPVKELSTNGLNVTISRVKEVLNCGKVEMAFFTGLAIANALGNETRLEDRKLACEHMLIMAKVAYKLNRLEHADQLFRWVSDNAIDGVGMAGDAYVDWASVLIKLGKTESAEQVIAMGQQRAHTKGDHALELHLNRLMCWQKYQAPIAGAVMRSLLSIKAEAEELGATDVLALTQYSIGVLEWRQGNFIESCRWLEEATRVCLSNKLVEQALPIYSTLSLVQCECGNYLKAADSCSKADEICRSIHSYSQYYAVCANGMLTQSRLGNLMEAERWLQEYLALSDTSFDLLPYLQTKALFLSLAGRVEQSIATSFEALSLNNPINPNRTTGKLHDTLATNFLFQGQLTECRDHCHSAIAIFDSLGDGASRSEIELISATAEACYDEHAIHLDVVSRIVSHSSDSSVILSAQTAVIAYLVGIHSIREHVLTVGQRVKTCDHWREVPMFHLLVDIADLLESEAGSQDELGLLKSNFGKLNHARLLFVAMLVGMKIADSYGARGLAKHEYKYLEQSCRLARELGNRPMLAKIEDRMSKIERVESFSREKEATLLSISKVLKEDTSFELTAHHLLEFAVAQTGAERGVLLLARPGNRLLKPVASVDCDDATVRDVTDFSQGMASSAAVGKIPTVIEDALLDERTRSLKSIVLHNVRSVVACPLMDMQDCVGVLYLDHHTLPSLFSDADLSYASAVANFITVALQKSQEYKNLLRSSEAMNEELHKSGLVASFLTQDRHVLDLLQKIPAIARSDRPVLILGESGTGKEILSKMIHELSPRGKQPLIKLNCAAISSTLLESELFGVAKGVATGVSAREGKFEAADEGTLYLDEIGDMPIEMQAKILRVLEYQQFERVGSNKPLSVNVRLIYATNKDLLSSVKNGKFKLDLFHRINKIQIVIPPLRERPTDIPLLVNHFANLFADGGQRIRFSSSAESALISYEWPGNVRELRNLVERYCVVHPGQTITPEFLPPEIVASVPQSGDASFLNDAREAESIRTSLIRYKWNKSRVADHLGIPLTTLRRKIEKYRIRRPL